MKRIARIAVLLSAALCMAAGATGAGAATSGQVSLDQAFDPERETYSATVAHDVTEVMVTASPEEPKARVTVNGGDPATPVALVVGENTIEVVVTAPDERYTRTYTVTVTREAAPATAVTVPAKYGELIVKVRGWRDDLRYSSDKAHTDRWDRVLKAFGLDVPDGSLEPMGAAEAQTYADRGWTRWTAVAEALGEMEAGGAPASDPVVTIAAGGPVTEGTAAGFTLTASPAPAADLAVEVSVSQNGAFAQASTLGTRTVTIPAGTVSAAFAVATVDDNTDETDGGIAATLAAGSGYTPGSAASATVAVADDDPSGRYAALIANIQGWRDDPCCVSDKAHTDRWDRVLLAFGLEVPDASLTAMGAAEAQTYADRGWTRWTAVAQALGEMEAGGAPEPAAVPVVTIAAGDPVTEGAGAGFTLTASPAPAADLAVAVSVSQNGAFADASVLGARTVTIPAGTASAAFAVTTVDDTADEADGALVAALASGSGYTPGAQARATVAVADDDEALPALVTKRSIAREGTDASAVFTVRLSGAAPATVTVDYATADGAGRWAGTPPATAGADYTANSGTLTFAAGQTLKTVSVPVLDDAIDEGTEYFLLRFSNPDGATLAAADREVQGLIRNSDPLPQAWLGRFGRTVASDAVAAVTARLETPRAAASHLTVAGQRLDLARAGDARALTDALTGLAHTYGAPAAGDGDPFAHHGPGNSWNDPASAPARSLSVRELLRGMSFRAVLGQGAGSQLTTWGQGMSVSAFSSAVPGLSLSGESATGSLGMDYERGQVLAGFAMLHSLGDGTARGANQSYALGTAVTTVLPFARLRLTERLSAWGLAGTGSGRLTLDVADDASDRYRTDLAMTLAAVGVRGDLVTPAEAGGFALALKADAFRVRTESDSVLVQGVGNLAASRAEASRLRAVLDGSRTFVLAGGAALTPSLALGVRHDGGDEGVGTGMELGAGLGYADPTRGLDAVLRVHGLAAHAGDDRSEWGVSGSLRLAPGATGRGLSASLTPSWGAAPGGAERLWAMPDASALTADSDADPSSRLDAELGYGVSVAGGFTGTPNVGFGLTDAARTWRVGWRLTPPPGSGGFELNLDAIREEPVDDAEPDHGVMLRSVARW